MNTSTVIRFGKVPVAPATRVSIQTRGSDLWHSFTRKLFGEPVLGNPLHEAWSADGEPLDRMTPEQLAKSSASRYLVVPHNRGR